MKKTVTMLGLVIAALAGLYLLVMQPSLRITKRLELLQQEEYAQGCKKPATGEVAPAAAQPSVPEADESPRQAVAEHHPNQQRSEVAIGCPDTASRANLIAIDSLRLSSFAAVVAYLLGFGSLLSIVIAVKQGTGDSSGDAPGNPALMALRISTTGPDHATLVIMNVGVVPVWLRSIHVNDDPAVLDGTTGGIISLPAGRSHVIDVRLRPALGVGTVTVQVRYDRIGGELSMMSAVLIHLNGTWCIRKIDYYR